MFLRAVIHRLTQRGIRLYDLVIRTEFCKEHKEYFMSKVQKKLSDGTIGIYPFRLVILIHKAERCTECKCETTFPSLYIKEKKMKTVEEVVFSSKKEKTVKKVK